MFCPWVIDGGKLGIFHVLKSKENRAATHQGLANNNSANNAAIIKGFHNLYCEGANGEKQGAILCGLACGLRLFNHEIVQKRPVNRKFDVN